MANSIMDFLRPRQNAAATLQPTISSMVKGGVNPRDISNTVSGYYDGLGEDDLASPSALQELLGRLNPISTANAQTGGFNPAAPYPQKAGSPLEITVNGGPMAPQEQMFEDQPIGDPSTLSGRIQEWLGAKEPVQQGTIENILSNRGKREYGDIGEAAVQTLMSGKPVSSQSLADQRLNDSMQRMKLIEDQQMQQQEFGLRERTLAESIRSHKANEALYQSGVRGGSGSSTTMQVLAYLDEQFPDMDPMTKLRLAQNKLGTNLNFEADGSINPMQGAADSLGTLKYGETMGGERAKNAAELELSQGKRAMSANNTLGLADQARQILPNATSGPVQNIGSNAARLFGISTDATQADKQLQVIGGYMTANVPRMEGPQSNFDVQLYREMAADVGNSSLSVEDRLAALDTIEQLQQKYAGQSDTTGQLDNDPLGLR